MYDLIVTLLTEICRLCSVFEFAVVCVGLLVSLFVPSIHLSSKYIMDICTEVQYLGHIVLM